MNKYGLNYCSPKGFNIKPKKSEKFNHRFGGQSWKIKNSDLVVGGSTLLFVFDLKDPAFSMCEFAHLDELPIASYLNCDLWLEEQIYKINPNKKSIELISQHNKANFVLSEEDCLPNPLPEIEVSLCGMSKDEYLIDEKSYWRNTDEFLGGSKFFRVGNQPIWLEEPQEVHCGCNKEMIFIMSIGYEGWNEPFEYLHEEPFYFGEGALYIFFCPECNLLKVISQST